MRAKSEVSKEFFNKIQKGLVKHHTKKYDSKCPELAECYIKRYDSKHLRVIS